LNAEPYIVRPEVLADLGEGDARKGAVRLKMMIADTRDRKPIMGPTLCPPDVRIAGTSDEPAIEDMLERQAREIGLPDAPPELSDIQDMVRRATRETGLGVIGVIDVDGKSVATVGVFWDKVWWTSTWVLVEKFNYVDQAHRRSTHANHLLQFAKWCVDTFSRQLGNQTYLMHGVTGTRDVERKGRLLNRQSNFCGMSFVYPKPGEP